MNAIRLLRDLGNLTQAELAEAAGTSQPTIAAYEAGRKSPTLRTLRRLAEGQALRRHRLPQADDEGGAPQPASPSRHRSPTGTGP